MKNNSVKITTSAKIILTISIILIIIALYNICNITTEYNEAEYEYSQLINENIKTVEVEIDNTGSEISNTDKIQNQNKDEKKFTYEVDLNSLKKINKDTVGWIILADTEINYPIVQTDNNDKYLNTTFEGKTNKAGAIYLDMNSNIDDKMSNLIIYGHNMKNGTMFRHLNDLVNLEYFEKHKVFNIDLGNGFKEYEIISCYETTNTDLNSWRISFNSTEDYENWLTSISNRCGHPCMKYDSAKQTVILSTCRGRSGGNGRFVVYLQER